MTRSETLGVAGAGRFGRALARLVAGTGRSVVVWSQRSEVVRDINDNDAGVRATEDPAELSKAAQFLVIAVGSTRVRERARLLGDYLDGSHQLVHAVGALAAPGDVRVSQVLSEETPVRQVGVLAGPALPEELADHKYGSMVVASQFDAVTQAGRRLLNVPELLRVYSGRDLIGVELAAALSGAHTVALGMADALQVGAGPRAVLLTRAVAEASRLGSAAGAEPRTFSGLAGLGNLLVRSSSSARHKSRDYRLGIALGTAGASSPDLSAEGARAAGAGVRLAARLGVRVPLLQAVTDVLDGRLGPRDVAAAVAETVAADEWGG